MRGDLLEYAEKLTQPIPASKEQGEAWIVTTVVGDMVRAKCADAFQWRQAHYVARMRLIRRKRQNHD